MQHLWGSGVTWSRLGASLLIALGISLVVSISFGIISFLAKVAIVIIPLYLFSRWIGLHRDILGVLVWILLGYALWNYLASPVVNKLHWILYPVVIAGAIYVAFEANRLTGKRRSKVPGSH